MKKVIIESYIQGLASFLDEQESLWEYLGNDKIAIYYNTEVELFQLGFSFGEFYESIEK
jgi:hypothetical protein